MERIGDGLAKMLDDKGDPVVRAVAIVVRWAAPLQILSSELLDEFLKVPGVFVSQVGVHVDGPIGSAERSTVSLVLPRPAKRARMLSSGSCLRRGGGGRFGIRFLCEAVM